MDIGALYQFVLLIVLVGFISGVGVLALDKFGQTTGITDAAQLAINNSRDAVASVPNTWLSLVVTIGILAVIIALIIGGFYMYAKKGR